MEKEEVYKDPLLSRLDLATKLDISEGYLSQIINQEINKSVIQFVNEYRIEAAKKLLLDPVFNKYSVEAIGMESGFKSKSAFYSTFKINLEMSPALAVGPGTSFVIVYCIPFGVVPDWFWVCAKLSWDSARKVNSKRILMI